MSDSSTFDAKKHSIMIIDDEPDLCELIEFQLQKEGYKTETLTKPLEAIGKARDFRPDLIILDVMMPELDGLRLCSMIKVDSELKDVPILFLTARSDADERVKGFERGADDYLIKPFDNRELVARTKAILARTLKR
jgi:DNA-binding response OmpR family regulator